MSTARKRLRFAVALKGGISLAVWIGGACRELALLTEAGPYQQLASRFEGEVAIDVISGTSAGGLNGVLLAQSQAYGASFDDSLRTTWLELADLSRLARRPFGEAPLSLLRGDHGFYPALVQTMSTLAPGSGASRRRRVRLLVTTTRVHERPRQIFPAVGPTIGAASSAAWFKFITPSSSREQPGVGGLPQPHHIADDPASRERLAYAARCTSSYPGAFEPGRIAVTGGAITGQPLMAGCVSETDAADADGIVEVMDGGVLDNIPIAWALRGIAAQPADGPVERWLLYLDPSPADGPLTGSVGTGGASTTSATGFLRLIGRAIQVKASVESLLDDAAELAALDDRAAAAEVALKQALSVGAADIASATGRLPDYALSNGLAEVSRMQRLLADPAEFTSGDPLPVPGPFPLAGDPLAGGLPDLLRPPSEADQVAIGSPAAAGLVAVGAAARTPLVAARALTVVLQRIQETEQTAEGDDLGSSRELLYAVRDVIEHVVALRDRHLLLAAAGSGRSLAAAYGSATARMHRTLSAAIAAAGDPPADRVDGWRDILRHLPLVAVPAPDAEPLAGAPYERLWEGVRACMDQVIETVPSLLQFEVSNARTADSAFAGVTAVYSGAANEARAERLAASEVLTGALRPDPLSSLTTPAFAALSASARTPLHRLFWDDDPAPHQLPLRKLVGNELAAFGGFLSARWRNSDWIWGRLDAVPTIVAALLHTDAGADDELTVEVAKGRFLDGASGDQSRQLELLWNDLRLEELWADPATTPRFRLTTVLVARRQFEILQEELPRLLDPAAPHSPTATGGAARPVPPGPTGSDATAGPVPPGPTGSDAAARTASEAAPSWPTDYCTGREKIREFAAIGSEDPLDLIDQPALRRTVYQLGLGAFRGLTSLGGNLEQGPPSHPSPPRLTMRQLGATALRALLGPFVVPPVLLSLTAPVATLVAGILTFFSLSAASGTVITHTHLVLAPGIAVAVMGIVLRFRRRLKRTVRTVLIAGVLSLAVVLAVCVIGLFGTAGATTPSEPIAWLAGVLAGSAFLCTQARAMWALRASRPPVVAVVVGAVVVGVVVGSLAAAHWVGIAILYAGLAASLVALYAWVSIGAKGPQSYPAGTP